MTESRTLPCFDVVNEEFLSCVRMDARFEILYRGAEWAEGPVYFPAGRFLLWSDVPANRLMRWDETTGQVGVFREPSNFANGNTRDRMGRLVTCEHGSRGLSQTEHDGSVRRLVDSYRGARLNSPNDLCVARNGDIWFTDPTYGIDSNYEGHRADGELAARFVFHWRAIDGELVGHDLGLVQPNGIGLSPDEATLYIVDSGRTHVPDGPRCVVAYSLGAADGAPQDGRMVAEADVGVFDGFAVDSDGRLWAGAGDGVYCLKPDGTLLGKIITDRAVANVTFGGPRGNRLFICSTDSVYAVNLLAAGAS